MKQYTYEAIEERTGASVQIRCTAAKPEWARLQIVNYYGRHFAICETFRDIDPPHHVLGEIDAASMTERDAKWLAKRIASHSSTIAGATSPSAKRITRGHV